MGNVKLVISIDEEAYKHVRDRGFSDDDYDIISELNDAVERATVLPDTYGRLIDADALITTFQKNGLFGAGHYQAITDAPTILGSAELTLDAVKKAYAKGLVRFEPTYWAGEKDRNTYAVYGIVVGIPHDIFICGYDSRGAKLPWEERMANPKCEEFWCECLYEALEVVGASAEQYCYTDHNDDYRQVSNGEYYAFVCKTFRENGCFELSAEADKEAEEVDDPYPDLC